MFLFLSKFLPLFVYPVGLAFILIVTSLFLTKKENALRFFLVSALIVLFVAGNSWFANWLARSLEWIHLPAEETPHAEVMVLLGGGTEPPQAPRQEVGLNGAGDRLVHAAYLYHAGAAEKILVSGGGIEWMSGREISAAEEMRELLVLMGVPAEAVILQDQSANTYEDAVFCDAILEEMGVEEIILVTSAMHMPRSVALFEYAGLTVIPSAADFKVTETRWEMLTHPSDVKLVLLSIIPSADNVGTTTNALKEYIGMLIYTLRGWM
ncbi:MAG: YdcF family protein [Anaerolineaceae bacterium]|nr:YdcF family protein [Anaerolineaceae bacterium]